MHALESSGPEREDFLSAVGSIGAGGSASPVNVKSAIGMIARSDALPKEFRDAVADAIEESRVSRMPDWIRLRGPLIGR